MRTLIFFKIFLFLFPILVFPQAGQEIVARNGMVVSESEIASEVGVEILKEGGNAIDAAVATAFALAVTYPSAGNIGGGGFMVLHLEDGRNTSIDFREKAPAKSFKDMYLDKEGNYIKEKSKKGMLAVGVPGSVAGLYYAWKKYGKLDWKKLLYPAINLARNGFPVNYYLARSINYNQKYFSNYPSSAKVFGDTSQPFHFGDTLKQFDLANTLEIIADKGAGGFYSGIIAEKLVSFIQSMNGIISLEDLKNYSPVEREPVKGEFNGFEIISMPPPSSGGIALLQILNSFNNFEFNRDKWGSAEYVHVLSEIFKQVFADRSKHLGDPDFYNVPTGKLISKDYGKQIARNISYDAKPSDQIYPVEILPNESEETTHFATVDKEGNAVSVTTTLNSSYGNKIVAEGLGFLLNNEMDDFSAKPGEPNQFGLLGSEANSIQPNKRMLSSMTPTIVLKDGKPYLLVGAPGGSKIITSVAQVIINVLKFNMDLETAVNLPRFHHQWYPERIDYDEFGLTEDVRRNLINRGHNIGKISDIGRIQAIKLSEGLLFGVSDKRCYGKAIGY